MMQTELYIGVLIIEALLTLFTTTLFILNKKKFELLALITLVTGFVSVFLLEFL